MRFMALLAKRFAMVTGLEKFENKSASHSLPLSLLITNGIHSIFQARTHIHQNANKPAECANRFDKHVETSVPNKANIDTWVLFQRNPNVNRIRDSE